MEESIVHERAERIRDVILYLKKFKEAVVIIYLDDRLMDSPVFLNHIKDICLIHESGMKVIVVPGAAKRIDEILTASSLGWTVHNDCRITDESAMPLIKMAAFDVSNQVMTAFAGEKTTAVIGNWVRARGKGVIDGFDYGTIGEIDKLQINSIKTVLDNGFIPIFPCIGWSIVGKPYNISSIHLAAQIAEHLHADKLFYLVPDADISQSHFTIPADINTSPEGTVPAMNLEEVESFLAANKSDCSVNSAHSTERSAKEEAHVSREKIFSLLRIAKKACAAGVTRVHILNGSIDGTIPCEVFSDLGSGTMVYTSDYGGIRNMQHEDIPRVLSLMKPFVKQGILLPRTEQMLSDQCSFYIVYELDGAIRACSSLIPYSDGQMEIAGVTVAKSCSHMGIGPKMISFLVKRAHQMNAKSVFLLTTQTSDWFENLGFKHADVSILPEARRKLWTPQRGSKVLYMPLS